MLSASDFWLSMVSTKIASLSLDTPSRAQPGAARQSSRVSAGKGRGGRGDGGGRDSEQRARSPSRRAWRDKPKMFGTGSGEVKRDGFLSKMMLKGEKEGFSKETLGDSYVVAELVSS